MSGRRVARITTALVAALGALCTWAAVSAPPAAATLPSMPGVGYGPNGSETVDIYPAAAPRSRLVIMVHGGGWKQQSSANLTAEAQQLQAAGFAVVNVNYRADTSGSGAFPIETYDLWLATQWSISHAAEFSGDPNSVTMLGFSSGGQLVARVSQMLPPGTLKAVVTLSGAFDFRGLMYDGMAGSVSPYLASVAAQALNCAVPRCSDATEAQWSPADHVTSSNCPSAWLLYNSEDELMPLDQPTTMTSALQAEGCHVTESILPGTAHAMGYWGAVAPAVTAFIQTSG